MISALLVATLVLVLGVHLTFHARNKRERAAAALSADAASIAAIVLDARNISTGTAGVVTWAGTWNGQRVQIGTIVDTLATRKLPALWLSVTVTEKVSVPGTFDMMMRPGSATTFSNFDHLPETLRVPADFPAEAVVRTDLVGGWFPADIVADHLGLFADGRAKELLVTPNGVRIVWLLAEADRARYGVFRQAAFSGALLEQALLKYLLVKASGLRRAINADALQAAQ